MLIELRACNFFSFYGPAINVIFDLLLPLLHLLLFLSLCVYLSLSVCQSYLCNQ